MGNTLPTRSLGGVTCGRPGTEMVLPETWGTSLAVTARVVAVTVVAVTVVAVTVRVVAVTVRGWERAVSSIDLHVSRALPDLVGIDLYQGGRIC